MPRRRNFLERSEKLCKLYISVLSGDVGDAGAGFLRIQVVVTQDQGFRIAPVKVFQESTEQLMVARAVAIDVAIIATHLQTEIKVVFLNIRQILISVPSVKSV